MFSKINCTKKSENLQFSEPFPLSILIKKSFKQIPEISVFDVSAIADISTSTNVILISNKFLLNYKEKLYYFPNGNAVEMSFRIIV